jgi:SAM-dependent methyltransferase
LDYESIIASHELAARHSLESESQFIQADAWRLNFKDQFHIVVSNGLNNYVGKRDDLVSMYKKLYDAVKPSGLLLTSFLTPSPDQDPKSTWDMEQIDADALRLQKIIFDEIVQVRWNNPQTLDQMASILEDAGFGQMELIFDKAKMYPTVVAQK